MNKLIRKILGRDKLDAIKDGLSEVDTCVKELCKTNDVFQHRVLSEFSSLKADVFTEISKLRAIIDYEKNFIPVSLELLNLPKSEKKKILVVGFYGASNLGDELMLETLLQYLEDRNDIQITVMLCRNPGYDIRKYKDINFIHYPKSLFDINSIAGYFDTIIFGGGAIIDDTLYNTSNPNYDDLGTVLIDLSVKSILRGKNVYHIALSSNRELKNKDFIDSLSFIVKNAKHFSIRDKNSVETLKKVCLDSENILLTNDIVFANTDLKKYKLKRGEKFQIGLNLICEENTARESEEILLALEEYLKDVNILDYSINMIPFYSCSNNDIEYYSRLKKIARYPDKIHILKQPLNMKELCHVLLTQDIIVSMRYHCTIIALSIGIPTLAICYDKHSHYPNKMEFLKNLFNLDLLKFSTIDKKKIAKQLKIIQMKEHIVVHENLLESTKNYLKKVFKEI